MDNFTQTRLFAHVAHPQQVSRQGHLSIYRSISTSIYLSFHLSIYTYLYLYLCTRFCRHGYSRTLRILNKSRVKARFELVPQDEASATIGFYSLEPSEGVIDEGSYADVTLTFTTVRLGLHKILFYFKALSWESIILSLPPPT